MADADPGHPTVAAENFPRHAHEQLQNPLAYAQEGVMFYRCPRCNIAGPSIPCTMCLPVEAPDGGFSGLEGLVSDENWAAEDDAAGARQRSLAPGPSPFDPLPGCCDHPGCEELNSGFSMYCSRHEISTFAAYVQDDQGDPNRLVEGQHHRSQLQPCGHPGCLAYAREGSLYCSDYCAQPVEDRGPATLCSTLSMEAPELELTPLQRLLQESPPCSIEALLDDDDIIQEFCSFNERLLERLAGPEGMRVLLEQITRGPEPGADAEASGRTLRRRPWIVTELLTFGIDALFDSFGKPGGEELLDVAWSFLDHDLDPDTAAVLSGYFCSCIATLLSKRPAEVAEHLRRRDPVQLLESFLRRLESRSLAELLALLICAETAERAVFPVDGLVLTLTAQLNRPDLGAEVLEHIVLILEVLLARSCMGVLYACDELLSQFADPQLMNTLVDQALLGCTVEGCTASSSAAASVLSIAVFHMHLLPADPLLPTRSPEFRSAPPSPPQSSSGSRPPPPPPPPPPPVPPPPLQYSEQAASSGEPEAEPASVPMPEAAVEVFDRALSHLDACADALVIGLCAHIPRLRTVLDIALERTPQEPFRCPQAGTATLEVIALLALLLKTEREQTRVFDAVHDAEFVPRCLEVFFHFSWNNLLHNAVTSVFHTLSTPICVKPLLPLLARRDVLERVVSNVQYDAHVRNSCRSEVQIVGFLGHLRKICTGLWCLGAHCPEVRNVLVSIEGWTDTILPQMEAVELLESQPLGGPVPEDAVSSPGNSPYLRSNSEFDYISAGAMASLSLSSHDEMDMNLEDLRDLDDEQDEQQVVAMASAHAARRARVGDRSDAPDMLGESTDVLDSLDTGDVAHHAQESHLRGSEQTIENQQTSEQELRPLPGPLEGPNAWQAALQKLPDEAVAMPPPLPEHLANLDQ